MNKETIFKSYTDKKSNNSDIVEFTKIVDMVKRCNTVNKLVEIISFLTFNDGCFQTSNLLPINMSIYVSNEDSISFTEEVFVSSYSSKPITLETITEYSLYLLTNKKFISFYVFIDLDNEYYEAYEIKINQRKSDLEK